ncbi:enoyl-CoA hydratase/isomerase family protein [Devosia sp.]|uniref:enoyl-CoA hydratase/isomerase family protein n=1 Tax=Devosia sp. TaxID=1871048 RepID=UPI001ACF587A|nr:enoyl-CoA hydratase/isomerase family protein [Devosia sp.]MBN9336036.1 enoyl-CoA hydratase/isomerase family protein [Devosia sp.]
MSKITIDQSNAQHWKVTINNPPINTVDDLMYDEFFDLYEAAEQAGTVKVITFDSANPDYFLAHYGVGESASRFGKPRWIDTALRMANSPIVSIATIRGRARGGGSEFALACDLRFASRERAVFGQPEVGFGLIPGGGALQRLPLLTGRSRALEIVLGGDDFDADTAERYGWINRALPDAELDGFVADFVSRILSFDSQALNLIKSIVNETGLPSEEQLRSTQAAFSETLRWPEAHQRMATSRERGLGQVGAFERDLGAAVAALTTEQKG